MGCKYVKEFEFPSSGKVQVKGYSRGGPTPKAAVHAHEKNMHAGKPLTKMAGGGRVAPPPLTPPARPSRNPSPRSAPVNAPSANAGGSGATTRRPSVSAPRGRSVPVAHPKPLIPPRRPGG